MTRTEALRQVIAAEDAAIYGYGIVAGQLAGNAATRARRALHAHRTWRDRWAVILSASGETVPPAEPAYQLPFPVQTPAAARQLAAHIDARLVGWYADLVAATQGDERSPAIDAARECATRAVVWGAPSQAFPGETDDQ
jgi:hypothetical protein